MRKLIDLIKMIFRRKKSETVRMNVKVERGKLRVDEQEIEDVLRLMPKRRDKPITHPERYGKFFKQRQPTTARKLWKKNAKIEEDEIS